MTDSSSIFPQIPPNQSGNIVNIPDQTILLIIKKIEARLNGSFDNEEEKLLKGLIHLAYNKGLAQGRKPVLSDLIDAIERTEKSLPGEDQIRKFKELKDKLKASNS